MRSSIASAKARLEQQVTSPERRRELEQELSRVEAEARPVADDTPLQWSNGSRRFAPMPFGLSPRSGIAMTSSRASDTRPLPQPPTSPRSWRTFVNDNEWRKRSWLRPTTSSADRGYRARPGRPRRDPERAALEHELERTSKALHELAIENTLLRGKVDGA